MKEREFSILMSKAKAQVKDILQERGKDYGSFSDVSSFVNEFYITNIKSVVDRITELNNDEYNRAIVALFMLGVKLARIENDAENPHFDSVIDFLGYLELLKETGIKGLELKNNLKCSTLHKRLIEYANNLLAGVGHATSAACQAPRFGERLEHNESLELVQPLGPAIGIGKVNIGLVHNNHAPKLPQHTLYVARPQ